jgi:hypothetical protein
MATFSISLSVEVEADSYEEAYAIEKSVHEFVQGHDKVDGVYEIDVECTDGELDEDYDGQPDEAQEWHDFDPDC